MQLPIWLQLSEYNCKIMVYKKMKNFANLLTNPVALSKYYCKNIKNCQSGCQSGHQSSQLKLTKYYCKTTLSTLYTKYPNKIKC